MILGCAVRGGNEGTDNLTQTEGLVVGGFTGTFTGPAVGGAFQMSSGNDIAVAYGGNITADYTGATTGTSGINLNLSLLHSNAGRAIGTSQSGSDVLRGILNITGSEFDDTIIGDNNSNILSGGIGDDSLFGGLGNDTLIGGLGDDTMNGQAGNDSFVISDGDGNDIINQFAAGLGVSDTIDFNGVALLDNFADVIANATQVGANVEIDHGTGIVTLVGVIVASLVADDFLF